MYKQEHQSCRKISFHLSLFTLVERCTIRQAMLLPACCESCIFTASVFLAAHMNYDAAVHCCCMQVQIASGNIAVGNTAYVLTLSTEHACKQPVGIPKALLCASVPQVVHLPHDCYGELQGVWKALTPLQRYCSSCVASLHNPLGQQVILTKSTLVLFWLRLTNMITSTIMQQNSSLQLTRLR